MSFLESGGNGPKWIEAPLQRSIARKPGCEHCGSGLEMNWQGKYPISGKCDNCLNRVGEGEEIFDDPEY